MVSSLLNGIKEKQMLKGYPQEQAKVEGYNKIVIAEFLQVEDEKDGAKKYQSFERHVKVRLQFSMVSFHENSSLQVGVLAVLQAILD